MMRHTATTTNADQTLTLGIAGMTCGSCKRHVEAALGALPGVYEATADVTAGTAEVRFDPAISSSVAMAAAVQAAGYRIRDAGLPVIRTPGVGSDVVADEVRSLSRFQLLAMTARSGDRDRAHYGDD